MELSAEFFIMLFMIALPVGLLILVAKLIVRFFKNLGRKMKESEEQKLKERIETSYELEREWTQYGSVSIRVPFDKTVPYDGKFLNFEEFSIFVIIQEVPEGFNEEENDIDDIINDTCYDYFDNHLVFHDRYAWTEFLEKYSGDMTKFSKVLIFKKSDTFRY